MVAPFRATFSGHLAQKGDTMVSHFKGTPAKLKFEHRSRRNIITHPEFSYFFETKVRTLKSKVAVVFLSNKTPEEAKKGAFGCRSCH